MHPSILLDIIVGAITRHMTIYSSLSYLDKQRFIPRQIRESPPSGMKQVIVIPCFAEKDLLQTLNSLEACEMPGTPVEVLIVLNHGIQHGEHIREANRATRQQFQAWNRDRNLTYHMIEATDLPKKHAGVGLARKIGMDEAVDRLQQAGEPNGLIINLDADSRVDENYLVELSALIGDKPHDAWSIYFEHPLEGVDFSVDVYDGIVLYELFLRYYIEGLRFAGYPMAYHTIGSSMVVRSKAYQAQGGMSRRKAGEDFYFLHKFSQLGKLGECNRTRVIPSPRPSQKVPFGTGKAIQDYLDRGDGSWPVYPPDVFIQARELVEAVPGFQHQWPGLPDQVERYLREEGLPERLPDIRHHATSSETFQARLFAWLDPLKVLRLIHFLRDEQAGETDLVSAGLQLGKMCGEWVSEHPRNLLFWYRARQRNR